MYCVYVLYSIKFDRFYRGITDDIDRRLKEHNNGKMKSTKAFKPFKLVYFAGFENRMLAREKEKYLKSGIGREKFKELWSGKIAKRVPFSWIPACRQAGSICLLSRRS